jgi:hypothetical protein
MRSFDGRPSRVRKLAFKARRWRSSRRRLEGDEGAFCRARIGVIHVVKGEQLPLSKVLTKQSGTEV